MASIAIRNLGDDLKQRLRVSAAEHGGARGWVRHERLMMSCPQDNLVGYGRG